MTYARPFRLHHTGGVSHGAVFPSGHAIILDDPEHGFASTADTLDMLLLGYHRSRIEWPDTGTTAQAARADRFEAAWQSARQGRAEQRTLADTRQRRLRVRARRIIELEQRVEQLEAALVRVQHVAALIHAGAPWTANRTDTAARIRAAIAGPGTATAEETVPRALFDENARRHQAAVDRVDELLAAIERVRKVATAIRDATAAGRNDWQIGQHDCALTILAALTEPAPAATEATDTDLVPCPSCLGAPPIPRHQLADHNIRHHPHHQEQP